MLRAVKAVKAAVPDLVVITDVALDPYTTTGHDGVLNAAGSDVDNDATVEILAKMAVVQADAGVDWVALLDMMDGRVGAIRSALDAAGHRRLLFLPTRQVRFGILWSVPRCGWQSAGRREKLSG